MCFCSDDIKIGPCSRLYYFLNDIITVPAKRNRRFATIDVPQNRMVSRLEQPVAPKDNGIHFTAHFKFCYRSNTLRLIKYLN